jgi:hypothetical protein
MIKIILVCITAFLTGLACPVMRNAALDFTVSHMPTVEKRGDTEIKFNNEFLEVYYHPKHGAFACYFDLKSETWKDMASGYEI